VEKHTRSNGAPPSVSIEARHGTGGSFATIEEAIEEIRAGRPILVVDDEDRENEGDIVVAAEKITPEIVNLMVTHARGLICVPMTGERLAELDLGPMVTTNTAVMQTGFTVSVDYVRGTTTGISAADRARTILALVDPATRPADLARPGHIFPLIAREGGVLRRTGHTEAAVDLARLAGLAPAGVLCEVMSESGEMARLPELEDLGRRFGLKLVRIHDLVRYRWRTERTVSGEVDTALPTAYGEFRLHLLHDEIAGSHVVALTIGDVRSGGSVLTRVHSQCLTGDVFGSLRCDCGEQIDLALSAIAAEGRGILVYLEQEGRGIGLANKLRAYRLQDTGLDTVEANERLGFRPDEREYAAAAQVLRYFGVSHVRLMTNNPEKVRALEDLGIAVRERVAIEPNPRPSNTRYLEAKRDKLGHRLEKLDGALETGANGRRP
jgi:3,4-dihydroxy 2-butanone 4-phosphate synthase/GTP cyclohydrolase II